MSENNEQEMTFPGSATDKDVDAIVRNPRDYGFRWESWDASSRKDKDGKDFGSLLVLRKDFAVIPFVEDAEVFMDAFGADKLRDAYNGTSGRVAAQEVGRSMLLADWGKDRAKHVTEATVRPEVVKRVLLGMRAKGGGGARKVYLVNGVAYASEADAIAASKASRKFVALDGKEYPTGMEAKQASVAFLVESQGMEPKVAAAVVANMPE